MATRIRLELAEPSKMVTSHPLLLSDRMLRVTVNRSQFETLADPWLKACEEVCERVLAAARMTWAQIDDLILTGGSSQLPCVERRLRQLSGLAPERITRTHPRASVVYGVALLAQQLYGDTPTQAPPLLQSVSTNELGLRVMDTARNERVFEPMIGKNVPLPTQATRMFYAETWRSQVLTLEIIQRKDSFLPAETLGEHVFTGLPRSSSARPLEVTLGYDREGRVAVTAVDAESGLQMQAEVGDDEEAGLLNLRQ